MRNPNSTSSRKLRANLKPTTTKRDLDERLRKFVKHKPVEKPE